MSEHEQDSVDIVSQNARDLIEAIEWNTMTLVKDRKNSML
jgi:hypothetical protein